MSKISNKIKIIDNHCHVNFNDYDNDRNLVIKNALDKGVGMIVVGTNKETSLRAVKIAEEHDGVWAIVGLHPIYSYEELKNESNGNLDYDFYKKLTSNPKVVGIGECGYDFFHYAVKGDSHENYEGDNELFKDFQTKAFLSQINLANETKKPLMLHIRNAYDEAIQVLKSNAKVVGDAHFFAGNIDQAKKLLDMGFYLSWTGVVTFTNDYDDVIKYAPIDRMLSETDAPYVSPVPNRGKRNEPAFVIDVVQKLAEKRGEEIEVFKERILENSKRLFIDSL